jgi:hypothetical protein
MLCWKFHGMEMFSSSSAAGDDASMFTAAFFLKLKRPERCFVGADKARDTAELLLAAYWSPESGEAGMDSGDSEARERLRAAR